uniref:Calcium uniporter protein n=1 Tax=Ciona savignyi TaxID=51511 RepID=H2Y3V4_CIOSA
ATIAQSHGLPVISVPLPSRREVCRFTLRPVTSTVGDFLQNIRNEDLGVDRATIHSTDGCRVASSTLIGHLLTNDFMLTINDKSYPISPPHKDGVEGTESLDEVRSLVGQLYTRFDVGHHQLLQEQALESRIDGLRVEMEPLEKLKKEMSLKASRRTNMLMWGGLAFMAGQFGVLARLTWWEYSWDIMEPVTYFITYGTAIIMYGYFLLTQQVEYLYPDARDRVFLKHFHRQADSKKFNIDKYNQLCDEIARAQQDLARLRDPLQLNLPPEPIRT